MKNLEIEIVAPSIIANFEDFKANLDTYTKQFEIEVKSDNLKEAKESGAELNKLKKQVKETAKKYLDEIEAPIKVFKEKIKEIETLLDAKRLKIADGISVFEDAKRLEHTEAMRAYLSKKLQDVEMRDEFKNRIKLSNPSVSGLTAKGDLAKKFRDEIDASVSQALEAQRLKNIELENQRLKDEARAVEIASEMRLKEQQEHLAYKEQEPKEPVLKDSNLFEDKPKESTPTPPELTPKPQGKSVYKITLEFEVKSRSGVDCQAMIQKVLPMIFDKKIPIANQTCEEI